MDLVGNYGINIHFSDGHTTGIFTFQRLRADCPCEACRGAAVGAAGAAR